MYGPLVMEVGGDRRAALYQHPPGRAVIGPLPAGRRCVFRFAIGLKDEVWDRSDGVTFRAALKTGVEERTVFEEHLDPGAGTPGWRERSVQLGDLRAPSAPRIVLETGAGPEGDRRFDQGGWAEPRIECERPATGPGPNVVLISIDTLRADRLGVYGHERDTSPGLDRLAESSLVFTNAFATAPWTLPSHASMFTGLLPDEHGAGHGSPYEPLSAEAVTLAGILTSAGYRTIGFSAGGFAGRRFGLANGFERWFERPRANLKSVVPEVLHEIEAHRDAPFFLFLHTFDVHGPYMAWSQEPPEVPPGAGRSVAPEEWERIRSLAYHEYHRLERFASLAEVVAAYDAGVRHVDAQLGRILGHLEALGELDETLVIVTSDHGESFYEDQVYIGHSFSVADREIRVPLIVRLPGAARRGRFDELVSLVDVAPLVLDVTGLGAREPMTGSSPLARLEGREAPRRRVLGESVHTGVRFARSAEWKVATEARAGNSRGLVPKGVWERLDPRARAVAIGPGDLAGELDSAEGIGPEAPEELRNLRRELRRAAGSGGEPARTAPSLDPAQIEELRALGYIQ